MAAYYTLKLFYVTNVLIRIKQVLKKEGAVLDHREQMRSIACYR